MASPTGQTGKGKFPAQLVVLVPEELRAHLDDVAARNSVSVSEVARTYIEAGREVAEAAAAEAERELAAERAARLT